MWTAHTVGCCCCCPMRRRVSGCAEGRKRLGQLVVALERWRRQLRPCGCGGSLSDDIAQCPWCHYRWDLHAQSQASYADRATLAYIQLTTRKCPNPQCGERVSHFHGHGCHHISPMSDGCPSCHTHFCYICGRAHGRPGGGYERHHRCRHGSSYQQRGHRRAPSDAARTARPPLRLRHLQPLPMRLGRTAAPLLAMRRPVRRVQGAGCPWAE